MSIDTAVARLADRNAVLAPTRHPDQWCLCGRAGCLAWKTYLTEAKAVYGHEPTEEEMAADVQIRMAVKAIQGGGAR